MKGDTHVGIFKIRDRRVARKFDPPVRMSFR